MTDLDHPDDKAQAFADFFVAGGTLAPHVPSYVTRPADDELLALAASGEFCYVLTTRQMGKSSLMVRTARRLQDQGVRIAIIDLTATGTLASVDAWYLDLLTELADQLDLSADVGGWWQAHAALGPVRRFVNFMRDVVLAEIEGRVVVFVDEIDMTLQLDHRDDFFAAIRAMFNARARHPDFNRLTFVLLGVAAPSDLIKDPALTPFNVGQGIALGEFSQADAQVLQEGLEAAYPGQGAAILRRIYHWTGGHPYLTQKLCLAATEAKVARWSDARVDALVERLFLSEEARKEANLKFVQDKVLAHPQRRKLFKLYAQVLVGHAVQEDAQSTVQNHLRLSGLVKAQDRRLHVRNRIYRRVFDTGWVKEHTPFNWTAALASVAGIAVFVALLAVGAIAYNGWVDMQVQDDTAHFYQAATSDERLTHLAEIFHAQPLFGPTDYDLRARELFFGLSRDQQLALFTADGTSNSDRVEVIQGLYVTLADVDQSGDSSALLEAMAGALEGLETAEATRLQNEIDHWLQGRSLAGQGRYTQAREAYDAAIALNGENPATRYERARVLVELAQYQAALSDLDRIMAVAQSAPEPTLTPTPMLSPSLTSSTAPTALSTLTRSPAPDAGTPVAPTLFETSATPTDMSQVGVTVAPTLIPMPAPPTPTHRSIRSGFATLGQMVSAVRELIERHPDLLQVLANASNSEYTNLRESGLLSLLTPQPFTRPRDGAVMVYVPSGTFQMGSTDAEVDQALEMCNEAIGNCERGWFENEQPAHTVTLDSFWIDQYEVSNAQYHQCVTAGACEASSYWDDADFNGDEQPVVGVSWYNAQTYCEWIGGRLPTEAEWEYAARGVEGNVYPWGDTFDCARGNFDDETSLDDYVVPGGAGCDGYDMTAPVGRFEAGKSWCGVHDMAGNVWEWVADWYGDYPSQAQTNPAGPETGAYKVLRGGGWYSQSDSVRSAYRYGYNPSDRGIVYGFRCGGSSTSSLSQ
jgi:formylglycine-generating enzyme required for sulfatase activity